MNATDFFTAWNGKYLDTDKYPADQPYQCVDVINQYHRDVVGGKFWSGNAIDRWSNYPTQYYDRIPNTPTNAPKLGDIVIWGAEIGPYGHIAVVKSADANGFTSFDQNWPLKSACHFQPHGYHGVLGWLTPKVIEPQMSQAQFDELNQLRAFKQTVVENKLCEYRFDPEPTVYQVFAIPSEDFLLNQLGDSWDNVRVVVNSKYPKEIDDAALHAQQALRDLQNAPKPDPIIKEVVKEVPGPTPDPVVITKEVPAPAPTYTPGQLFSMLIKSLTGRS